MPIHLQQTLSATPEAIYHNLTDSGRLAAWFAEHADIALPKEQYDFWGRFTPGTPDRDGGRHKLLKARASNALSYGWRLQEVDTVVDIRLVPRGAETAVIVQHFAHGPEGAQRADAPIAEDFWFLALENLRRAVDGRDEAVVRLDLTASMLGDVTHTIEIDASPEAVFKALIEPEQMNRWIASKAVVEPHVGGRYDLGWGMGPEKILELAPNERLAVADAENPGAETQNVLTWTLEGSGGRTRLTLVHSGFAADHDNSGLYTGWLNFMSWIKSLVEYGPSWQPTLKPLPAEMFSYYPASISSRQADLLAMP
ncbi:MAG: SRPBCC family protein, partial [Anaerolineales bacterium]